MSDSKLVVDILNKFIDCPWRVLPIAHSILESLLHLNNVEIIHVWHKEN